MAKSTKRRKNTYIAAGLFDGVLPTSKPKFKTVLDGGLYGTGATTDLAVPDIYLTVNEPAYGNTPAPAVFEEPPMNVRPSGAMKDDKGKRRWRLVPMSSVGDVVDVMEFGSKKYGDWNWYKGFPYLDLYDAAMRHLEAWMDPRQSDYAEDSKLHHFSHAAANLLMLLEQLRTHPELDNRPGKQK